MRTYALLAIVGLVLVAVFAANGVLPGEAAAPRVGVQLSDHACGIGGAGSERFTSTDWSAWAKDANGFDPDCARVNFSNFSEGTDFRIGIQTGDESGCGSTGSARFAPWA